MPPGRLSRPVLGAKRERSDPAAATLQAPGRSDMLVATSAAM